MGEANYSMLASFPKKLTEEQQKAIREFFIEGSKSEDWWQDHRGESPKEFWPEFKTKFPVVSEYLKMAGKLGKDNGNGLAGQLDFGSADDVELQLSIDEDELTYTAYVWHFADWNPLVEYLTAKYGADRIDWASDEYDGSTVTTLRLARKAERAEKAEEEVEKLKATLARPDLQGNAARTTKSKLKRKLLDEEA